MIESFGAEGNWLFKTKSAGRWAKWVGHADDGIKVSSICNPGDPHPPFRWNDRSRDVIGVSGQICFDLSNRPTLKDLRDNFGTEWNPLWDRIQEEYDEAHQQLKAGHGRGSW
ncbi:hypothetical protein OG203_35025 [Nocardia sp. NBC_01499]|uniref:hypothetical protein n=1 Tax=Nocardia sp. NBC_01499 TaxID=2903597 RepID=UPI003867894D